MKKLLSMLLTLAVCSAALCVTAAGASLEAPSTEPHAAAPAFARVWGQVSPWDGTGIFLKNDDEDSLMNEVVLLTGEEVYAVDAASGLPLDLEAVQEGDTLYAWAGPAMTLSLPPQVNALAIVGNVPDGTDAPEFCEIARQYVLTPGEEKNGKNATVFLAGGETMKVTEETVYTPWLTKQIVTMENLIPGTRALVWKGQDGAAEKVLLFPYGYQGYLTAEAMPHGDLLIGLSAAGQDIVLPYKQTEQDLLIPVRAVAEGSGYEVRWDKTLGAVVSLGGETVFSVRPGADVIVTPEGESGIFAPCVLEDGVTYLPAEDLCHWLNLYYYAG